MAELTVHFGDNLPILRQMEAESIDLIYIDPPFNTGKAQRYKRTKTIRDERGDRIGFQGERYRTVELGERSYQDRFGDFGAFIRPRIEEAHRLLKPTGSLFFHLDWREIHRCRVLIDEIFGSHCLINQLIWAYDFGGRSKKKWSTKHDTILWYAKNPGSHCFNAEIAHAIANVPPGETEISGFLGDAWWHTIVPTNGPERTGYPTQKPLGILKRIIAVHSQPGDIVLDFFAGSGTTGDAALQLGRKAILIDKNPDAIDVIENRIQHKEQP